MGTVAAAAEFRGIIHCVLARVTVVRAWLWALLVRLGTNRVVVWIGVPLVAAVEPTFHVLNGHVLTWAATYTWLHVFTSLPTSHAPQVEHVEAEMFDHFTSGAGRPRPRAPRGRAGLALERSCAFDPTTRPTTPKRATASASKRPPGSVPKLAHVGQHCWRRLQHCS